MRRCLPALATALFAASLVFVCRPARGADPTTADCLAASDASLTSGNEHKLRAERAQLLVCAAATCPADIRKECARRVDEVNVQIPTIIFDAKDASGKDLSAVRVTMDGQLLAERLEGTALSIDPGSHLFTFETAGLPTATKQLLVREAEKERRERITFAAAEHAPGPVPLAPAPLPQPHSLAPPSEGGPSLGTQKILAIAAAGVGVVGLGVGSVFGVQAMSKRSDAEKVCPGVCADQNGAHLWSDAKSAGNISTVGFVVGIAGVAGGAVLWLTAKPTSEEPRALRWVQGSGRFR